MSEIDDLTADEIADHEQRRKSAFAKMRKILNDAKREKASLPLGTARTAIGLMGLAAEEAEAQEAYAKRLVDLLIEARGLIAGLAADLVLENGTTANVAKAHDFHERLRIALAEHEETTS